MKLTLFKSASVIIILVLAFALSGCKEQTSFSATSDESQDDTTPVDISQIDTSNPNNMYYDKEGYDNCMKDAKAKFDQNSASDQLKSQELYNTERADCLKTYR